MNQILKNQLNNQYWKKLDTVDSEQVSNMLRLKLDQPLI